MSTITSALPFTQSAIFADLVELFGSVLLLFSKSAGKQKYTKLLRHLADSILILIQQKTVNWNACHSEEGRSWLLKDVPASSSRWHWGSNPISISWESNTTDITLSWLHSCILANSPNCCIMPGSKSRNKWTFCVLEVLNEVSFSKHLAFILDKTEFGCIEPHTHYS